MFDKLAAMVGLDALAKTKNLKGNTGAIMGLVSLIIGLGVGVYILVVVQNNMPQAGLTAAQQTQVNNVFTGGLNAFQLAIVVPLVAVIGLIFLYLGVGRGR